MDNHTFRTPHQLKYRIGYYEVNLVTFEIERIAYSFKQLDKDNQKQIIKRWLGEK